MRDRREVCRNGSDAIWGEAPVTGEIFGLEASYKIWFPKEIYSNAIPIIVFLKEKALKYGELKNAYISEPSASREGKAILWFTDIYKNSFVAQLNPADFKYLADEKILRIGVTDVGSFKEGKDVERVMVELNLYRKDV